MILNAILITAGVGFTFYGMRPDVGRQFSPWSPFSFWHLRVGVLLVVFGLVRMLGGW